MMELDGITRMELEDACSLAEYINGHGGRFCANVLSFGTRGWVIVSDKDTNRYLEPIANPTDYLLRARQGVLRIDAAYSELIEAWVTKH